MSVKKIFWRMWTTCERVDLIAVLHKKVRHVPRERRVDSSRLTPSSGRRIGIGGITRLKEEKEVPIRRLGKIHTCESGEVECVSSEKRLRLVDRGQSHAYLFP